eukprot:SAG11_NODE_10463_length_830_cov_1.153215_1_plen_23_part_10
MSEPELQHPQHQGHHRDILCVSL